MLTKKQASHLRSLITKYTIAVLEDSWKGGGDPAAIPEIEEDLVRKERALYEYIRSLTDHTT